MILHLVGKVYERVVQMLDKGGAKFVGLIMKDLESLNVIIVSIVVIIINRKL